MPIETFTDSSTDCIYSFQISHNRASEGYTDAVYDAEDMNEEEHTHYMTVPAKDGSLYFSVETYYQEMIPNECTTGEYSGYTLPNPVLDMSLYEDGSSSYTTYKVYSDQFNYPFLITDYTAGTVFSLKVTYTWFDSPHKDYTVKLYSK